MLDGSFGVETDNISLQFGGQVALRDVSLKLSYGQFVALIGPNGSGKTSLCNVLSGVYRSDRGRVFIDGTEITTMGAHEIGKLSLSRTFQHGMIVEDLSVLENVALGFKSSGDGGLLGAAFHWFRYSDHRKSILESSAILLEELGFGNICNKTTTNLSQLERKKLELARCVASMPSVLLLDELTAGLNQRDKETLLGVLQDLFKKEIRNTLVVVIEHDIGFMRELCSYGVVLNRGSVIAEGKVDDVLSRDAVKMAYLGRMSSGSLVD